MERSCEGSIPSTRSAWLGDVTFTSGSFKGPVKRVHTFDGGPTLYPLAVLGYEISHPFPSVPPSFILPAEIQEQGYQRSSCLFFLVDVCQVKGDLPITPQIAPSILGDFKSLHFFLFFREPGLRLQGFPTSSPCHIPLPFLHF